MTEMADPQSVGECHMLKLPPELRLFIYDFVFSCKQAMRYIEIDHKVNTFSGPAWTSLKYQKGRVSLLRTCKLIYTEAVSIFYDRAYCTVKISNDYNFGAGLISDKSSQFLLRLGSIDLELEVMDSECIGARKFTRSLAQALRMIDLGREKPVRIRQLDLDFWFDADTSKVKRLFGVLGSLRCQEGTEVVTEGAAREPEVKEMLDDFVDKISGRFKNEDG